MGDLFIEASINNSPLYSFSHLTTVWVNVNENKINFVTWIFWEIFMVTQYVDTIIENCFPRTKWRLSCMTTLSYTWKLCSLFTSFAPIQTPPGDCLPATTKFLEDWFSYTPNTEWKWKQAMSTDYSNLFKRMRWLELKYETAEGDSVQ